MQYFPEPACWRVGSSLSRRRRPARARGQRAAVAPRRQVLHALRHSGQRIGQFYLDLYARASKRGGAWMDDVITRRRKDDGIQTPVAYLNCNFSGPVGASLPSSPTTRSSPCFTRPATALHHLLTQSRELGVSASTASSGTRSNCPRSSWKTLLWSGTAEAHDRARRTLASRCHARCSTRCWRRRTSRPAVQTLRQIEFAASTAPARPDSTPTPPHRTGSDRRHRKKSRVIIPPAWSRVPNNFSLIFAGGYAAVLQLQVGGSALPDATRFRGRGRRLRRRAQPEVGHRFSGARSWPRAARARRSESFKASAAASRPLMPAAAQRHG